jgi:hypothetical protein
VPGLGTILRLVLLDAIHAIQRVPSGPDVVSSCRLVPCATASAGQRYGTAGAQMGPASLPWAFSEAAGLVLQDHPAGPQSLTRREKQQGPGKAVTLLAQQLGRAVSDRFKRPKACAMPQCLQAEGAEGVRLPPPWTGTGCAAGAGSARMAARRQCTPQSTEALTPARSAVDWPPPPAPHPGARVAPGCCGLPLPRA